jgi:hypothetical protein
VSTTLAINSCYGFSVIAGVVDKSEKLAPRPLTRVAMDVPFHGGFNEPLLFSNGGISSQFCRKNRPLLSQQFIAGVIPRCH